MSSIQTLKQSKKQSSKQTIQAKILKPKALAKCSGQTVALDTETTGLLWWKHDLIGLGVWCPDKQVYGYIPTLTEAERRETKVAVKELLAPGTTVIAHNAKFDLHFLDANPRQLGWNIIDTTVPVHLLDSRWRKAAVDVEKRLFGQNSKEQYSQLMPRNIRRQIWKWPLKTVAAYCINDARIEYEFAKALLPWIKREGLWPLFLKEMAYLKTIWEIERHGVLLDLGFVANARQLLSDELETLEANLYDAIGYEFNWRSHQQLSKALYEGMGHPRPVNPFTLSRFNKDGGKYNSTLTSTFILMEKAKHPLGELVSNIREAYKLRSYLVRWEELMSDDGYLHTTFNLTGTRTGRLSSSKPNFQNVPADIRGSRGLAVVSASLERSAEHNLRNAFLARPKHKFVSIDYTQMEMRMFGMLSEDPFMLKSLAAGRDIHGDMAKAVWGKNDNIHREWAKTVSFGLIYGMTTGSLQFKLELSLQQAKDITGQYWKTFPRIRPWLYGTADDCRKAGQATYWSGRRWVEDREDSYFKAANAQIQGGCADLISIAIERVAEWLRAQGWGQIVSIIHDEILLEIPNKRVDKAITNISKIMELPDVLGLPWLTAAKVGNTYGSLQPYIGQKKG